MAHRQTVRLQGIGGQSKPTQPAGAGYYHGFEPPHSQVSSLAVKLERLLHREDFRASPARALARRLLWRLRWAMTSRPWRLATSYGFPLWIGKTGSGALIYYQGASEPQALRFLSRYLREGMIVADVGAHFGEFAVFCALAVGGHGAVHAFEPHAEMFALLERNTAELGLAQVTLNPCAVGEADGEAEFWERTEPASSSLAPQRAADREVRRVRRVPVCSLDSYFARRGAVPHLIKADVEGAERRVILGARELCSLPPGRAPLWLLEYSVSACARAGENAEAITATLQQYGYRCYGLDEEGTPRPWVSPPAPHFPTVHLIASKQELT
jgi:FkbM family methyltransferase